MPTRFLFACLTTVLAVAALSVLPAQASDAVEGMPKGLSCTFTNGTSVTYEAGVYQGSPARPLVFDIDGIDLEGQRAVLQTGNGGKGEFRVVRAVNANHFLEVVNEGFLNMTTIYDLDPQQKAHPAVHSRHLGLLGQPIVAQYYGFCTEKR